MRVLLLTPHYPPEIRSVSRLMAELAGDMRAAGHDVTVVAPFPPDEDVDPQVAGRVAASEQMDGVRVRRVRTLPFRNVPPWMRAVTHFTFAGSLAMAALSSGKQDAVIAYSPPLTVGLACDALRRMWRAPFILNVQDIYPQALVDLGLARGPVVEILRRIERYAYRHAAAITVHSSGNRDLLLERGVPPEKVHVVFNWVDTKAIQPGPSSNHFRETLGLTHEFVVLFAGVLGYAQDIDVILEAARLMADSPNVVFVVAGEGVRKAQAVEHVRTWGLRNVRFLPFQPLDQYPSLVRMADVCLVTLQKSVATPVVPSKIMTIMAAGRPIVASVGSAGDAYDIITASGGGVCTPPGDARALVDAILTLYRDAPLRQRIGEAGRRFAEEHLDRRTVTATYMGLLDRVRGRGPVSSIVGDGKQRG